MSSRTITLSINPLSAALLGVVAALVGYQALAYRPAPEPVPAPLAAPSIIATFDIEKTFNSIDEKKAADVELTKTAEAMKTESEERAKKLKQMQKDLEDLQPGTPQAKELEATVAEASYQYQAQVEFYRAKLDIARSRTMQRVYQSIRDAAGKLAVERGIMVVFVNDSISQIPPGTEEETTRQISARRMVYASPEIDVTDELISRMNAAFKMAGPAPAGNP